MTDRLERAGRIAPELIVLRREIHRHPELGRTEWRTAERVERELHVLGIETARIAETGVIGTLRGERSGRCVALRADMDALPMQEETGLPFASENAGIMHACGHDLHVAALLGAARLLASERETLCGSVRFFFQPDEEGDGGARRMIEAGCMDGVDAVFGAHVAPELPTGTIGVRPGKAYAASNPFDVVVRGRSAHGAEPHLGADAIVAASSIVVALQSLVSRNVSPLDSAVISVGSFHAGTARNILADEARLSGILRCFGSTMRHKLSNRIRQVVEGVAASMGVEAEVQIQWGYDGIINDLAMTERVCQSAAKLIGAANVAEEVSPSLTTEDFGAFLECAPGSYWHIGVGKRGADNPPLHNPRFDPDESAIALAAAIHAQIAVDFLEKAGGKA